VAGVGALDGALVLPLAHAATARAAASVAKGRDIRLRGKENEKGGLKMED
jgi:hypothetical protein